MRLIDADAIDYKGYMLIDKSDDFVRGVKFMHERIEETPSIDIVSCQECKHYELMANGINGMCDRAYGTFYGYDYCSYGERREPTTDCTWK